MKNAPAKQDSSKDIHIVTRGMTGVQYLLSLNANLKECLLKRICMILWILSLGKIGIEQTKELIISQPVRKNCSGYVPGWLLL